MSRGKVRAGLTLLELIVVIAILGLVAALLVPAIQSARAGSARSECANNVRQIGLALHGYHDLNHAFPPAVGIGNALDLTPLLSWRVRIAPYLEQNAYWDQALREYKVNSPIVAPYHTGVGILVPVYGCPSDDRVLTTHHWFPYDSVAYSSYLGVSGIDYRGTEGILYNNSRTRLTDITDGTSSTLLVGERPPSNNLRWGWLYIGHGQRSTGSLDHTLGVRELNSFSSSCPTGPYHFQRIEIGVPCSFFQYWSLHSGGAHFLFADGSVRFLSYSADPLLPALATRSDGEVVSFPF